MNACTFILYRASNHYRGSGNANFSEFEGTTKANPAAAMELNDAMWQVCM